MKGTQDASVYGGSGGHDGFRRGGRRDRRCTSTGVAGRDSYWNCLAREYQRERHDAASGQQFTVLIASACPSERQNFRVTLVNYLSMQFPAGDAGAHMTTANKAIALAQKDIVTAFVNHAAAPK